MRKENRMIPAVVLLWLVSFFLFSQEETEKLSAGGILLLAVLAAGCQVLLCIRRRPWPDRRFWLLGGGMGMTVALLIWCAGRVKGDMEEYGHLLRAEYWAVFAAVLVWCLLCLWAEKGVTENTVQLILFGGFLLRLFYVVLVQSHILQNDLGSLTADDTGHMGYIYYLYREGHLPDVNPVGHYQFYHPPLHHVISALLIGIFRMMGYELGEAQELLQVQAVLYGTLTLFFVNKIGIGLRIPPLGRGIGMAFASFLPYGIMMGGALNNDSLMTLLAVMALYYTLVWYERPSYRNIMLMALCIGCAMMTKLSGAIVAPAMAVPMLYKAWKERERWKRWLKEFLCFGAVAFPLGLWYSVLRYVQYGMSFGYVPRLSLKNKQYIGMHEGWSRFFDFDNAFEYLALRWDNAKFADYNIFVSSVKCAVFGEGYGYRANPALAMAGTVMFWATLVLMLLTAAGCVLWLCQKRQTALEKAFIGAVLGASIVSYCQFCLEYPFVCTMNVRYIMVAVYLSFLIMGAAGEGLIERTGRRNALAAKGMKAVAGTLAGCYIAGAVALMVQAGQVLP